uniref:Uncharacterized protein n=1 Tax=Strombidinopsis acuminata TaxID=141414 RepID=A0A7S3U5T9_9SPIT
MRNKRKVREGAWNLQNKDINSAVGSSYAEQVNEAIETAPVETGYRANFEAGSSAPAASSNPFQFLIDIFNPTTTTTTTTPPPNPIEAFFKGLR